MSHENHVHDEHCGHDHDHDEGHEHSHEHDPRDELVTVRDLVRYATSRFSREGLFFGHGSSNAFDEAVYLVLHSLHLPLDKLEPFFDACIPSDERADVLALIDERAETRKPAAYLTGEAWLGPYRFRVDERVIIPRSFFAELLESQFSPWIADPYAVTHALDLCTGSGCLAILMAQAFPNAKVDAVDLSTDALELAGLNVSDYDLDERIELVRSDVFSGLAGRRYDFILSNPPYVTTEAMDELPDEYRHEPEMALAAGSDGLDIVRGILAGAREHLKPGGWLSVEVGHNRDLVEAAWPELPLTWLSTAGHEDAVFLIQREAIPGKP
ncbi:50S ribosomal protein L3 N(5)-glutamine methyltransferase [Niveibacterium sp. SC-1]|uniref:50S ribosomal protein L3 N(5)-glutamine methyltransferase n=1 Tax=Niveibacterium sp. SC-1 TaxID=3135646 RepID=UPI00311F6ABF